MKSSLLRKAIVVFTILVIGAVIWASQRVLFPRTQCWVPESVETPPPLVVEMEKIKVDMIGEGGDSHVLLVKVLFTVNGDRPDSIVAVMELVQRKESIAAATREYLAALHPGKFMGTESERSQALAEMKALILRAANERMTQHVDGVFFKEFILQ